MTDGQPPPLPHRPSALDVLKRQFEDDNPSARPKLTSSPTAAISSTNIQSQLLTERKDQKQLQVQNLKISGKPSTGLKSDFRVGNKIDFDKDGSELSILESTEGSAPAPSDIDAGSLLGEMLEREHINSTWQHTSSVVRETSFIRTSSPDTDDFRDFWQEFRAFPGLPKTLEDDERLALEWRKKRKHFLVLSQSGKPVWQRHGDDSLISGYNAAIQMIISFYETSGDNLKSFTAGGARFVVSSQGPLYLVAISKLGESEAQLRSQLDALYMQILSTLTFPNLERIFSLRPSTDLRRPLQGTETLLSALADSFTRGSPSTLLSSLECLRLHSRHRRAINDVLLENRCPELLYGLVVAGGRLVSVVRPKSHSLHPGDIQLLFNMLFEADGIQAGGGENWIPMCLPGFNRNGFLYMYVSYLDGDYKNDSPGISVHSSATTSPEEERKSWDNNQHMESKEHRVAILLISSKKDAFFELQTCRSNIVTSLVSTSLLQVIRQAMKQGRPSLEEIIPGAPIQHFLYKSRGNLQLFMPAWPLCFESQIEKRRLMSIYEALHSSVHTKGSHLRIHYSQSCDATSLAWLTNNFELYCVTSPEIAKSVLVTASDLIIEWIKKEEERIFIIGGATF